MTERALQLISGDGDRSPVTLSIALTAVRFWERAADRATDELIDATTTPAMTEARRRLEFAHDRLVAARNRRERFFAEAAGRPWLWLAGPEDEARNG